MKKREMTVGSLFDGIFGGGLGAERAGMRVLWRSEIDPSCNQLMADRRPEIPNLGDVNHVGKGNADPVNIIIGGFPCQDLSIAGKRAGLAGERSGLWFEFHRILSEMLPEWVVIENVPGLLSSCGCDDCKAVRRIMRIHRWIRERKGGIKCPVCNAGERMLKSHRGRDFAAIVQGLAEIGYGVSWRVLDAQYFGLAQRRKRIFIVGHIGDGASAEILFEPESGGGDTPAGKKAGQGIASTLSGGSGDRGWPDPERQSGGVITPFDPRNITSKGNRSRPEPGDPSPTVHDKPMAIVSPPLRASSGGRGSEDGTGRQALVTGTVSAKWAKGIGGPAGDEAYNLIAPTLGAAGGRNRGLGNENETESIIPNGDGVRRLTPLECERLQGFPDGWTAGQSDQVRYKQLGNAWAVPVAEWILRRIANWKP